MRSFFAATFLLTKFDVAERQLNQAVLLFFEGGDPVSVHTLAEAAAQILYDLRKQYGAISIFRDTDRVREEHRAEWLALLAKSRNFFKHADRDGNAVHEFTEEFNDYSLLDAANMYLSAKRAWTPETLLFLAWCSIAHPNTIVEGTDFAEVANRFRVGPDAIRADQPFLFAQALRALRLGEIVVPGVTLTLGLPE